MDPDQEFQVNPDTDPDTDPYTDPIWIQGFDDQKLKKKIQMKNFFDKKIANYLDPSYRRSLPLKHFKKMKFKNFLLSLWVIFALLDPDC